MLRLMYNIMSSSNSRRLSSEAFPRILRQVPGFEQRRNDLVIDGDATSSQVVVYFGGDIQDIEEEMVRYPETAQYLHWSLESTCQLLVKKFPHKCILAVRPSRKQDISFSCFDNFVPSAGKVSPSRYDLSYSALNHLGKLLENGREGSITSDIDLIGFSKGGVILNQLLYEISFIMDSKAIEFPKIVEKIRNLYWIDSGHWGPPELWITDYSILKCLQKLGCKVNVIVTPYQTDNPLRPAYKWQLLKFINLCKELSVLRHFVQAHHSKSFSSCSLEDHFYVLKDFLP